MVMSQQQCTARHIARTPHRSASTITLELHRSPIRKVALNLHLSLSLELWHLLL
jgi:hypothetical protein